MNREPVVDRSRQTLLPSCPQSREGYKSAGFSTVVGISLVGTQELLFLTTFKAQGVLGRLGGAVS